MFIESELVQKTREFAERQLRDNYEDHKLYYHNAEHTESVVKATIEIAERMDVPEDELETVVLAAWLHDIGYATNAQDHEGESQRIAKRFLSEQELDFKRIHQVQDAIEATRMPQAPKDNLSMILCDADLYHLSTSKFEDQTIMLKKEMDERKGERMNEGQWFEESIRFMQNHKYFTSYGQTVLEPRKQKNLKKLKKLRKKEQINEKYVVKLEDDLIKLKSKIDKQPTRGIETMFRITSQNHLQLSAMADNKANIMISVNAIILSIVLTVLFRKFEESPEFIIPGILLLTSALLTIVFAVFATRPNISSGTFTREDIEHKRTNLLFFGNFHGMRIDDYMWGMKQMMKDGDYLYGSLTKDIYYLGVVLGKKYRWLRVSYNVFMVGLIISILSFVLAAAYPNAFILF